MDGGIGLVNILLLFGKYGGSFEDVETSFIYLKWSLLRILFECSSVLGHREFQSIFDLIDSLHFIL